MPDGNSIRVAPDSHDRTPEELAKVARKHAEEGKVAIRNIRRDANEFLKKQKSDIPEDEMKKAPG